MFGEYKKTNIKCTGCGASGIVEENVSAGPSWPLDVTWVAGNSVHCHAWPAYKGVPEKCSDCRRKEQASP